MSHKDKLLLPVLLAAALAAGPALAQTTTAPGAATGTGPAITTPGTTTMMQGARADSVLTYRPRMSQLIGTNIYNDRNETIGEVDDIVFAAPIGAGTAPRAVTPGTTTMGSTGTTGSVTTPGTGSTMPGMSATGMQQGPMAVIQVGGFLGMGGRLVIVPLSELQWNAERERIIMPNATKESLQGRPAFTYDSLTRG